MGSLDSADSNPESMVNSLHEVWRRYDIQAIRIFLILFE